MKTTYDPEVDAFYLYLGSAGAVAKTVEVRPGIMLDFDAEGRLLGIEVLDASKNLPRNMNLARIGSPES